MPGYFVATAVTSALEITSQVLGPADAVGGPADLGPRAVEFQHRAPRVDQERLPRVG